MKNLFALLLFLILNACSESFEDEKLLYENTLTTSSGEQLEIKYNKDRNFNTVYAYLINKSDNVIVENYALQNYSGTYYVNRILNNDIVFNKNYSLNFVFSSNNNIYEEEMPLNVEPSVIIKSICGSQECEVLTGNILQNTFNRITIKTYGITAKRITYTVYTPYEDKIEIVHEYNTPVEYDYLDNFLLTSVPEEYSSYIVKVDVVADDLNGNTAETSIPLRVVRPIEVKHYGKQEVAEIYEPIAVTGCIPGSIGSNIQYTESESETRQKSVSINISKNWSDSFSKNTAQTSSEGISVANTESTVNSSSLSNSETQSESYSNTNANSNSSNISFNTSDGESWSWNLNESQTQTQGNSNSSGTNTGVSGSVTTGFSGEGSLPFLAKASGKVEVSAGVNHSWNNTNTNSESNSEGTSRGYTTGGSSQNGKVYGSAQNESRSFSLSGSYILSSSTSRLVSESSSLTSGRVWNMSESVSRGEVVTEGNSESISETVVTTVGNSTTLSYSGYIPRGRFGMFHRQTSRLVKLSEIITYDINGFPSHAGFLMMNTFAWAPELSVGMSCEEARISNLPNAQCIIPPCGE